MLEEAMTATAAKLAHHVYAAAAIEHDQAAESKRRAGRSNSEIVSLDEISDIVWKLLNDSVVESLDVLQQPLIILDDKVDSNSLAPKTA
jgi:hypothetical protein